MSQIICPITGEILLRSDLLLGMNFRMIHPFLQAKKEIILSPEIIYRFTASKNIRERKIYYLATLNMSDLVEFRSPANPDAWIMECTFIDLATLVPWIDYAKGMMAGRGERIRFPHYVVDKENADLKNISIWISALYDLRNLFLEKSKQEDLKKELTAKAADIEREWKRASAYGVAFTPVLAKWALDFANVEEGMYDIWKKMLCTPLEDAWTLNVKDLEEMLTHFQIELPINNDQVIAVIKQIKLLIAKKMEGYADWEFVAEDGDEAERIITEVDKIKAGAGNRYAAPDQSPPLITLEEIGPEPLRHQFKKSWEYTQAIARYNALKREATKWNNGGPRGEFKSF
jgi:hypothetical protein